VDVRDEFAVAPALSGGGIDERLTVAEAGGGAVEVVADGVAEQRDVPGTLSVAGQTVDVEAGHRILLHETGIRLWWRSSGCCRTTATGGGSGWNGSTGCGSVRDGSAYCGSESPVAGLHERGGADQAHEADRGQHDPDRDTAVGGGERCGDHRRDGAAEDTGEVV